MVKEGVYKIIISPIFGLYLPSWFYIAHDNCASQFLSGMTRKTS
jgi:hypothetical protein